MTKPIDVTELNVAPIDEELLETVPEENGILRPITRRDLRALAFHLLYAIEQFDYTVSLESVVDNLRRGFLVDIPDDSLAIILARGAIDRREELDKEIEPMLKNWRLERLGVCTRLILRLAINELLHTDVAPSIVINEGVELAKAFAERDAYRFVNGVLDEVAKKHGLLTATEESVLPATEE